MGIGCGRSPSEPSADAVLAGAATNLHKSFAAAAAEEKEMADSLAAAMAENNYNKAYVTMQQLNESARLSAEQRQAMAQQQTALLQKLRDASSRGDKDASELLQHYRATK